MPAPRSASEHSLIEIDDALNRLAAINPALRRVVELRVFEGLTREEIAQKMGCGTARSPAIGLRAQLAGRSLRRDPEL